MKKHCVAKILLVIWEIILNENNLNYNSYRFSYKFAFILFYPFLQIKNKVQVFSKLQETFLGFFCLFIASRALLQCHAQFHRPLKENFLTSYSCSYYSYMIPLITSYHLYFLYVSKVWCMLHHVSVRWARSKKCYFFYIHFLAFYWCFSSKICVFIIFIYIFWWSAKFPQQNINQS